jgi:transcriptional regulator with XRE-family HTH domain
VEKGHVPDIETFSRLANWLGRSPADFLGQESVTSDSTPDVIEAHLRGDPALSKEAAGRIAGIVREFYAQLASSKEVAIACHLRAASTFSPEASVLFSGLLREMHDALLAED